MKCYTEYHLAPVEVDSIEYVAEFHDAFDQPIVDKPNVSDDDLNQLRIKLLEEELNELTCALLAHDPVEVLDALTDLQYVLDGAYLSLGMYRYKDAALREVHSSNMSKLGEDGKPIRRKDGKVMKGPNYRPPNLKKILEEGRE